EHVAINREREINAAGLFAQIVVIDEHHVELGADADDHQPASAEVDLLADCVAAAENLLFEFVSENADRRDAFFITIGDEAARAHFASSFSEVTARRRGAGAPLTPSSTPRLDSIAMREWPGTSRTRVLFPLRRSMLSPRCRRSSPVRRAAADRCRSRRAGRRRVR